MFYKKIIIAGLFLLNAFDFAQNKSTSHILSRNKAVFITFDGFDALNKKGKIESNENIREVEGNNVFTVNIKMKPGYR